MKLEKKYEKLDAGESAFFNLELEHLLSRMFEVEYPDLMARSVLPISTEAGPGAETIAYHQFDKVGMAKLIADYADDVPRVDVLGKKFVSPIESIASSFGYSVQEIRAAAMANRPLRQMKAESARRADEQKLDSIACFGDANTGLGGMLNNANVPVGAATANWSTLTPEEIVADMQAAVAAIRTDTESVESPDTILLPESEYVRISQTQMTGINETILSFFLRTSPYIRSIAPWYRLETAGAGGVKRMVTYRRDPAKLELHIPQDFEVFPPQERNLEFVINTHCRTGGVTIYKPLSMRYTDGL